MVKDIKIEGKNYPITFSLECFFYYADSINQKADKILSDIAKGRITEFKLMKLFYAGLVYGALERDVELDLSFLQFQKILIRDKGVMDSLGSIFKGSVEELEKEEAEKKIGATPAAKQRKSA